MFISNYLQISRYTNLGNYLGYPLKLKYTNSDFNHILDKLHHRLQGWKQHLLSFAGRTQLIIAATNVIPTYHMRVFNLPKKTKNHIDQINKNFLCGYTNSNRKIHLISWKKITKPKHNGGLDIKNSSCMNFAFVAKLQWNLETLEDKPWVIFHKQKYLTL